MIVDLVSQLDVRRPRRETCVGDHRAAAFHISLLERQPRGRQPGSRTRWAHRMLPHEPLQMLIRRGAIATRLFELGEREERVVGVWRQRVLHDHAPVIALRDGRRLRERATPEECVAERRRALGGHPQHRVDDRATSGAVTLAHQSPSALVDGIGRGPRRTCRRVGALRGAGGGEARGRDEREDDGADETVHRGGKMDERRSGRAARRLTAEREYERREQLLGGGETRVLEGRVGGEERVKRGVGLGSGPPRGMRSGGAGRPPQGLSRRNGPDRKRSK